MRQVKTHAPIAVPYFLVGFLAVLAAVQFVSTTIGAQSLVSYDEDKAAAALMRCVDMGGEKVYDRQMRFSHCRFRG